MLKKEIKTAVLAGAWFVNKIPQTTKDTRHVCKIIWTCSCIFPFAMCFTANTKCQKYCHTSFFLTSEIMITRWISKLLQQLKILLSANCLFLYLNERSLYPQLNDFSKVHVRSPYHPDEGWTLIIQGLWLKSSIKFCCSALCLAPSSHSAHLLENTVSTKDVCLNLLTWISLVTNSIHH